MHTNTFATDAEAWISSRASKETRAAYRRDLALWLAHCKAANVKPEKPPRGVAVSFRDDLLRTRAPLTVRRILASLSAAYAAVLPGEANPFAERALPRPPASAFHRTAAASTADARKVIAAAGERGEAPQRDVALISVLFATGIRRVSAVSIRRDGLIKLTGLTAEPRADREGVAWLVRHVGKGGADEETELAHDAYQAVAEWLKVAPPSKWLFCTLDGSRALLPQSVTKIVAGAARAAGVRVHPHMFRSAAATTLLDAGVPLEQVRAFLHHKDIRSTLRYDRKQRGAGVAAKLAAFREKGGEG